MVPIYTRLTERMERSYLNAWWKSWNLLIQDHHLIKKNQMLCFTKLNSNELYKIKIIIEYLKPTFQSYFDMIFENSNLDWKTIYLLHHIATVRDRIKQFGTVNYELLLMFWIKNSTSSTFSRTINNPYIPNKNCEVFEINKH